MAFVKFKPWYCGEQEIEQNNEMVVILWWNEIEYSLCCGLVEQNCSWGRGWCGSPLVNMQFDINLANLLLQEEGKHLSPHTV